MPRDIPITRVRNVGVMAHIDAGKTTCSERMLLYTHRIHRAGEVHDGSSQLDWMDLEREKGITITSAATTTTWSPSAGPFKGTEHQVQLIDTPGHVDFTIEVERSLRVLDGAVAVFDAAHGVEAQSETVWRQADRYEVPRIAFVNKVDKPGADFAMCVRSLRERLGANALAVQLPLGPRGVLRGVIDLVRQVAISFDDLSEGRVFTEHQVPEDMLDEVRSARATLAEACAELDPELADSWLRHGPEGLSEEQLYAALRKGTLARTMVPVLCGSALKNKGIQMLLDAIVHYLPSPLDRGPVRAVDTRSGEPVLLDVRDDGAVCAMAFKSMTLKSAGALTFVRVYTGTLRPGDTLMNSTRGPRERVGRLVRMHADAREELREAPAGSIVAVLGFKDLRTGDTLCSPERPVRLPAMTLPEPVVALALEPLSAGDSDRMTVGLAKLAYDDPSLLVATDPESGQTVLRGVGELHLEIVVERLFREHGAKVNVGRPRVAYRETVQGTGRSELTVSRQNGGPGMYARVTLEVSAAARGAGLVFEDCSTGGAIPRAFVAAVEKGVSGAMSHGLSADAHPVVDVFVRLLDGATHPVDSNCPAFELAGSMAFKEACREAGTVMLEPLMSLEVTVPEDWLGEVLGGLLSRRGQVLRTERRGNVHMVEALVPLETLFGYVGDLRGHTRGRASASMRYAHHQVRPEPLALPRA